MVSHNPRTKYGRWTLCTTSFEMGGRAGQHPRIMAAAEKATPSIDRRSVQVKEIV
jgi:hypothetical protein